MRASIITCCDAPPVFEPAEHDLYFVPLLVERFAIAGRVAPTGSGWDARLDAFSVQSLAKFIAVLAFIADQRFCPFWQRRIDQLGADMIAGLPCRQTHDQGAAFAINNGVKL